MSVPGRIRVQVLNRNGYYYVQLVGNGVRVTRLVAHLVLETFVGPRPSGMEACHGPLGGAENRLDNLRWDSVGENSLDRRRHGTDHYVNRTHCPLNHLLVVPNLRASVSQSGRRGCLACNRASAAKSTAIKNGQSFDFKTEANRRYLLIMAGVTDNA
jgi:hypothetical protein